MSKKAVAISDYPLAENRPDLVHDHGGRSLDEITLEKVIAGEVDMAGLRITPEALKLQAEIARAAGRPTLAANFERAAELVNVPQEVIMEVYELLRPGRATGKAPLLEAAVRLRETFGAEKMAAFVEEAAAVYETRGLFNYRF